jgi:hypothetical protein
MSKPVAVRACVTAFFVSLLVGLCIGSRAAAQAPPAGRTALDVLVQRAAEQVQQRYARPLGNVAQRRRSRVFVLVRQAPPAPGTMLEAVRPQEGGPGRVVARLEVVQSEAGLTECRELERSGRLHADPGDFVRLPLGTLRLLLAPCIPLVDLAPQIPEVVGEKLRVALIADPRVRLLDALEAERRAEAAYLSDTVAEFMARLQAVDELLVPVLLQTPGKLLLNLEYFDVQRGRASEVEVVSVPLDDHLRAWLRAGRPRQAAPPGFRRLPAQAYAWRVIGLAEAPGGSGALVFEADTLRVLELQYPSLRLRAQLALGVPPRPRRQPWCTVVPSRELGSVPGLPAAWLVVLSETRRPQVLAWNRAVEAAPQLRTAPADVDAALERLGPSLRAAPARRAESRWWPGPDQPAAAVLPCFGDVDGDGRSDALWTGTDGILRLRLAVQRSARPFPGFGDVKALQPARGTGRHGTLWLTEPVWNGAPDRLHAAQLVGDELQVVWSSEPFDGTLTALATPDLNGDGQADLMAAESFAGGTRLHTYIAFPSERGGPPVPGVAGGRLR